MPAALFFFAGYLLCSALTRYIDGEPGWYVAVLFWGAVANLFVGIYLNRISRRGAK